MTIRDRINLSTEKMDLAHQEQERSGDLDSLMRETFRLPRFTEALVWKTEWAAIRWYGGSKPEPYARHIWN